MRKAKYHAVDGGGLRRRFRLGWPHAVLLSCGSQRREPADRLRRHGAGRGRTTWIAPNSVGTIVVSHLHGDHFGGLVWWLIHARHAGRRTEPLTVIGPAGIEARVRAATEIMFPGCDGRRLKFDLWFVEIQAGRPITQAGFGIAAFEVSHPSGAPAHALRVETAARRWRTRAIPNGSMRWRRARRGATCSSASARASSGRSRTICRGARSRRTSAGSMRGACC